MQNPTALPKPLPALASLLTDAGYRKELVNRKHTDNLRADRHGSALSNCRALHALEKSAGEILKQDAGPLWADLATRCWRYQLNELQRVARSVDQFGIDPRHIRLNYRLHLQPALLLHWLREARDEFDAPKLESWFESPFRSWVEHVSVRHGLAPELLYHRIAANFEVHSSTRSEWLKGLPLGKPAAPYSGAVQAILQDSNLPLDRQPIAFEEATGWLTLAIGFQTIPMNHRRRLLDLYRSFDPEIDPVLQLQDFKFQQYKSRNTGATQKSCLEAAITSAWGKAQELTREGKITEACTAFHNAVKQAWWAAGKTQQPLLEDALMVAVAAKDNKLSRELWSMLELLGINQPKKRLDDTEKQRILLAFKKHYPQQNAKGQAARLPHHLTSCGPVKFSARDLKNPDRVRKNKAGATPLTNLMQAIAQGDTNTMQKMLDNGGNVNKYIHTTGENPLSKALERACLPGDFGPLELILFQPSLSTETLNRPFLRAKNTPLGTAIDTGNSELVSRLISLGARVEAPIQATPCSLVYAMTLLLGSTPDGAFKMTASYMNSETGADEYDALFGAVSDRSSVHHRTQAVTEIMKNSQKLSVIESMHAQFFKQPAAYRSVIDILLNHGADPNFIYSKPIQPGFQWTPTLMAAELGDKQIMRALLDKGGDPTRTLMPESGRIKQYDAAGIAWRHGHHDVSKWIAAQLRH